MITRLSVLFLVIVIIALPSYANEKVLRYVSIRSSSARMHVGPGLKYPVNWHYVKKDLPLEVLAEYEHWRKVRDIDGASGWIHKSLLSGKRVVWIVAKKASLYRLPEEGATLVAHIGPSVLARLIDVHDGWCKVEVKCDNDVFRGWLQTNQVWGLSEHELQKDT